MNMDWGFKGKDTASECCRKSLRSRGASAAASRLDRSTLTTGHWPLTTSFPRRFAFTLVELLVVITIIGILIAMLLPAVQAAREAARRMQCQNNIKQLGLAVLNYESQYKIFPPSSFWPVNVNPNDSSQFNNYQANWAIAILPFLDQQALHDKFDFTKPISGGSSTANIAARGVQLSVMLCPTDSFNRKAFAGSSNQYTTGFGDNWARGNYAANAAIGQMDSGSSSITQGTFNAALPSSAYWKSPYIRGMMGANCSVTMADIKDGSSNTIMLGEIRAGLVTFDPRGVWALSGGSSALWGDGAITCSGAGGDDSGPNNLSVNADDITAGADIASTCGGSLTLIAVGMPCVNQTSTACDQVTARSLHPNGVNMCFADGSVHWISDYIQTKPSTVSTDGSSWNLSVWDRLMCSADGQVVNTNAY
jgi:prepilin-type N-terminal cleavage/methylation domain-containing protein/prepilin-type processing-associated H-X9-DG protein